MNKVDQELENSTFIVTTALGGFVIAALMQIYFWDKYSLDIIPLTVKEVVGATSPADWEEKATICTNLKKWDCVEAQYLKAAQYDKQKYVRLGRFQYDRKNYAKAARSFAIYFSGSDNLTGVLKGEDVETALIHAKALTELNQSEEAAKYYEKVLEAKPDQMQVSVIHGYVKMLFKNGKYGRARVLIEDVRKHSSTAAQFMEAEYQQIRKLRTASR